MKFSIIPHSKYRTAIRAVLLYILKKERERERGGGDDFGKDGGKRRRVVFAFSLDCTRAIPSPNNTINFIRLRSRTYLVWCVTACYAIRFVRIASRRTLHSLVPMSSKTLDERRFFFSFLIGNWKMKKDDATIPSPLRFRDRVKGANIIVLV